MSESASDNDLFVMMLAAPLVLPVIAPVALGAWEEGREWMIERGFIAPADEAMWAIPGWDGAGIGSAHVVLLACLVVLVMVIGSAWNVRQRNRRIDTEGWGTD